MTDIKVNEDDTQASTQKLGLPSEDFFANLEKMEFEMDGALNQIHKTVLHNARQIELLTVMTQNGIVLEEVIELISKFVPSVNSDAMNALAKTELKNFMQYHCERPEKDNVTYKAADDFINLAYKMKAIVEN